MKDHNEVKTEEIALTGGSTQFPGLHHTHSVTPNIHTIPFKFDALPYQYSQASTFYSYQVAGSYKRRCLDYESIWSYDERANSVATHEAQPEFITGNQESYEPSTPLCTIHASVSLDAYVEGTIEPLQRGSLPVASYESEKHAETSRSSGNEAVDKELVCYGQLNDFCEVKWPLLDKDYSTILWDGDRYLLLGHQQVQTDLPERAFEILNTLYATAGARFDLAATASAQLERKLAQQSKVCTKTVAQDVIVHIVIYAAKDFAEDIGSWLDEMGLFLQLPTHSKHDVLYCNPHAMSSCSGTVTTGRLSNIGLRSDQDRLPEPTLQCQDLLTQKSYQEASQPILIRSILKPHQLQALMFMQGRELGWDLHNERETDDLWRCEVDGRGRPRYRSVLSSESRYKPPVEFRGGILADEMGLGKTCTMLSLIASGLQNTGLSQNPTLVVVPLPVLQVWEKQIDLHFRPQTVVSTTYYKPTRGCQITFDSCNVVITTYNTVSKEWKAAKRPSENFTSPLFNTSWHRVVLDEAHVIKNKDTDIAKAVSALNGERRWCITGTPLQNRSTDLYSLFKFLRVYPYDDYRKFETTFVEPWTQHHDNTALRRFQAIMATIAIRRPRRTIELPERIETTCHVCFSPAELQVYEQAKSSASDTINEAVSQSKYAASGAAYLNALQRINDLRYICNHGTRPKTKKQKVRTLDDNDVLIEKELHAWIGETIETSTMCDVCGYDLVEAQEANEYFLSQRPEKRSKSCPNCDNRLDSASLFNPSASTSSLEPSADADNARSSKILKVVSEVLNIDRSDKCVVFSYWTSTLKGISYAFADNGIEFLMYDGSMSRTRRDKILLKFKQDANVRAILVSISCGGQGLDLTAANHAFMVEPQWNPMLEEQAMARVHRLGQQKQVNLVRMIVKGTFEENIVNLQKRKRLLADLIVDNQKLDKREEVHKHLMQLRDLVS